MQQVFLAVYFAGIPALCTFALYKFARIWLWAAPIIITVPSRVAMMGAAQSQMRANL